MAIEREKILEAALAVLNEVGLDRLTTRRLAERLGVQQPALYWHFASKSLLLDALNEEMLKRFHSHRLPEPGETWDAFMLANARSFRRAMLSVRDGARINAGTRPSTSQFADAERQLQLYVDAGFTADEAFAISIAVARYVVGFVLEEQDERERDANEPDWSGNPMDEIKPFPLLTIALQPLVNGGTVNTESVFESGLEFMLVGVRASLGGQKVGAGEGKPSRKRLPPPPR